MLETYPRVKQVHLPEAKQVICSRSLVIDVISTVSTKIRPSGLPGFCFFLLPPNSPWPTGIAFPCFGVESHGADWSPPLPLWHISLFLSAIQNSKCGQRSRGWVETSEQKPPRQRRLSVEARTAQNTRRWFNINAGWNESQMVEVSTHVTRVCSISQLIAMIMIKITSHTAAESSFNKEARNRA